MNDGLITYREHPKIRFDENRKNFDEYKRGLRLSVDDLHFVIVIIVTKRMKIKDQEIEENKKIKVCKSTRYDYCSGVTNRK